MNNPLRISALLMVMSLFALGLTSMATTARGSATDISDHEYLTTQATMDVMAATTEATPKPVALGNGRKIENVHSEDRIDKPGIVVEIDKPVMSGDTSETVKNFNEIIDTIIENTAHAFAADAVAAEATATLPPDIPGGDNFVDVNYEVLNASDASNIVSIKFNVAWYSKGAAHPNSYSVTANYDLKRAKQLELADLFKPKTDYLAALSKYAVTALKAADRLEFPEGAGPAPENFRSWNITPIGLQINFDDYQVTSHATGPQTVIVPFSTLKHIIDPAGPLSEFVR